MALIAWVNDNWFNLSQTILLGGTLWIAIAALKGTTTALQTQNLFAITQQHRDIWSIAFEHPDLWRVIDPKADLERQPPTHKEERFVQFLIFHLLDCYRASASGLYLANDHLKRDIKGFFGLPIPRRVWEKFKNLQDVDFVRFVDANVERP